jgi:SAM-dependent methyltransferase
MNCRHCHEPLSHTFVDLGFAPPSNAYLTEPDLTRPEKYYPLKVKVCDQCWLVQTEDYAEADELFNSDYAYFSSTSTSWLEHARSYAEQVMDQFNLDSESCVIEVASNDGYLLKNFVDAGIPCLGIEPTVSTAVVAEKNGIPVLRKFFGEELAKQLAAEGRQADLIAGNNVYAHVPDINDFTAGLREALKPDGTITLEFPHLLNLIEQNQFDTIYHEHFSYLSLHTVSRIFQSNGLSIYDVEQLETHGGSLRIYGCHQGSEQTEGPRVLQLLELEKQKGLQELGTYIHFQQRADVVKNSLLRFLLEQKQAGKTVAAYGAAAKGNTLLNYAGIKPDMLAFVCDAAEAKQGKYLPGSHLPIFGVERIRQKKPDFIVILPWNLRKEVTKQLGYINEWGGNFVTAVPKLTIFRSYDSD